MRASLVRLLHLPGHRERRALHTGRHEGTALRHTPACEALFGELNHGLGPGTHHGQPGGAQRLQPLVHPRFPRGGAPLVCHRFLHHVSGGHILAHQPPLLQEGFVHGPTPLPPLSRRDPLLLPGPRGRLHRDRHGHQHTASGRRRTAHLRRKTATSTKLPARLHTHAARETAGRARGDHQPSSPTPTVCGFPPPGLRLARAALHGLLATMDTALRTAGLLGQLAHALCAIVTQTRAHP